MSDPLRIILYSVFFRRLSGSSILTDSIVEAYTFDFTYTDAEPRLELTASVKDASLGKGKGKKALRQVTSSSVSASGTSSSTAELIYKSLKVGSALFLPDQRLIVQQVMSELSRACREFLDLPSEFLPVQDRIDS